MSAKHSRFKDAALTAQEMAAVEDEGETSAMMFLRDGVPSLLTDYHLRWASRSFGKATSVAVRLDS